MESQNDVLPAEWKRWLAENRMLDVEYNKLLPIFADVGFSESRARAEIESMEQTSTFQAGAWLGQRLRKLESIFGVFCALSALSSKSTSIQRRSKLCRADFLENYYAANRPVILVDIMHNWKALSLWSPDYLKETCGDETVEVMTGRECDPNYEIDLDKHRTHILFKDFIDMVVTGGETNDYYLVANNFFLRSEGAKPLYADMELFPQFLDNTHPTDNGSFWFGPAGTVTHLHHDLINILAAQVYGRKRVILISPDQTPLLYNDIGVYSKVNWEAPDYERYPRFKDVKALEVILEPGEVLFIPVGWWHYVKALDVSITVSFINFLFPNTYDWSHPKIYK